MIFNVYFVLFETGNLHAGNVLFDGKKCQLLDLENWLLGVPSYYRSFFIQFKKIKVCTTIQNNIQHFYKLMVIHN